MIVRDEKGIMFCHIAESNVTEDAAKDHCPDHPDAPHEVGFGLAGGGYGPYSVCGECGRIFGKIDMGDDW